MIIHSFDCKLPLLSTRDRSFPSPATSHVFEFITTIVLAVCNISRSATIGDEKHTALLSPLIPSAPPFRPPHLARPCPALLIQLTDEKQHMGQNMTSRTWDVCRAWSLETRLLAGIVIKHMGPRSQRLISWPIFIGSCRVIHISITTASKLSLSHLMPLLGRMKNGFRKHSQTHAHVSTADIDTTGCILISTR